MKRIVAATVAALMLGAFSAAEGSGRTRIEISKPALRLWVISEDNDTLFSSPVGCGINYGQKRREGDCKTPSGRFRISSIENSSGWSHDFHDGRGRVAHAYGPWFLRLNVPGFRTIGIHGTCFPSSIGTRCSEGCVRLQNDSLQRLKEYAFVGMDCIILPDTTETVVPAAYATRKAKNRFRTKSHRHAKPRSRWPRKRGRRR